MWQTITKQEINGYYYNNLICDSAIIYWTGGAPAAPQQPQPPPPERPQYDTTIDSLKTVITISLHGYLSIWLIMTIWYYITYNFIYIYIYTYYMLGYNRCIDITF